MISLYTNIGLILAGLYFVYLIFNGYDIFYIKNSIINSTVIHIFIMFAILLLWPLVIVFLIYISNDENGGKYA